MMDHADAAAAFKGSAIKGAKLWMLKRNAAIVLENVGTPSTTALAEAGSSIATDGALITAPVRRSV